MRLLFVGDVVGASGCGFLAQELPRLKRELGVDLAVVNGENSAKGNGISEQSLRSLTACGADAVTTGNHCFSRRDSVGIFDRYDHLIRPANYPDGVIGKGVCLLDMGRAKVAVVNIMGTAFMEALANPFETADRILSQLDTPNVFVDFHAEATSEKKALGHYLTGRVTAVLGTHTHVQTADEAILGEHTAYITDAGMTGPELSVLGVDIKAAVNKQRFKTPVTFTESTNPCFLCAVLVDFDEKLGKATKIQRIIKR